MSEEVKAKSRIKNEESVATLIEKLNKAKTVVLTDQSGLSVSLSSELKKKLRAVDAESIVTKNTLLKIASKQTGHSIPEEALEGPTSALFGYGDEIAPIKELTTFAKTNEKPTIKLGFLGKDLLSSERLTSLAKLPSNEVLRGQVVGCLYTPLYGVVGVLNANIRNLVFTISAIKDKKSSA
jgi:large subunit ribosomal protein L10